MVQGDSYPIKVQVKMGGTIVTSENCSGMKIKLGSVTKSSEDGTVTYDSSTQTWLYPVTQAESIALCENAEMGVQFKIANNYYTSPKKFVRVERGAIREVWS